MPSRFGDDLLLEIDMSKRYDIYVPEMGKRIVVYRGARFRGMRGLEPTGRYDMRSEFYEVGADKR
jgi:hypothetical protein